MPKRRMPWLLVAASTPEEVLLLPEAAPPVMGAPEPLPQRRRMLSYAAVALAGCIVTVPVVSTSLRPLFSEQCEEPGHELVIRDAKISSVRGPTSLLAWQERFLATKKSDAGGRDQEEKNADETGNEALGPIMPPKNNDFGDGICTVHPRTTDTLRLTVVLLFFMKLGTLSSGKALLPQMLGSTDAAKRPFPFGVAFRLVGLWSFWGAAFALTSCVMQYQDRFSAGQLAAVKLPGSDKVFLILDDSNMPGQVNKAKCLGFDSYDDMRQFSETMFTFSESLNFALGSFLFGLGELFKLDMGKGYLFQSFISLSFVSYFISSLMSDKLLEAYDRLISKAKAKTRSYGVDFDVPNPEMELDLEKLQDLPLEVARQAADMAKIQAILHLRSFAEPRLQEQGLNWDDAMPIISEMDSVDDLANLASDPGALMAKLAEASLPAAKKLALAKLRPKGGPIVKSMELEWEDVAPILDQIDSIEELQKAADDPKKFLEGLGDTMVPMARKIAIAKMKSGVKPKLPQGVSWEDDILVKVQPVLNKIDTVKEVQEFAAAPERCLQELAVPIARKLALNALKPKLELLVKLEGLTWDDALTIIETVDSVEELQDAVEDPDGFFKELIGRSAGIAKKVAIMKLKPKLEPKLKAQNLHWEDVLLVLQVVDSVQELLAAIEDPDAFLLKMGDASLQVGIWGALAKSRPDIEPKVREFGMTWDIVKQILKRVDTIKEIQDAAAMDIEALEKWLIKKSTQAGPAGDCPAASANTKEMQKAVWPALFQTAATALWMSTASVQIDPCVSYEGEPRNSALMNFISFDAASDYFEFVARVHWCMIGFAVSFVLLIPIAGRFRCTWLEKYLPIAVALTLGAHILLLVANRPEIPNKIMIPGSFKALQKMVPISSFMSIGFAAEGTTRVVACSLSTPSSEEIVTYKIGRASMIKERAEVLVDVAPPALYEQALKHVTTLTKQATNVQEFPAVMPELPAAVPVEMTNWTGKALAVAAEQETRAVRPVRMEFQLPDGSRQLVTFVGRPIGFNFEANIEGCSVVSVIEDSRADKQGMRPGWQLVGCDGVDEGPDNMEPFIKGVGERIREQLPFDE